ncbi:MAG: flagellar biosynthesis anti-sigma factor FlgM [Proteobacteria bacterium]|nr:flagellar biosynthesis anti-sigma factor FlgM [Pseudomonadota bacterium]
MTVKNISKQSVAPTDVGRLSEPQTSGKVARAAESQVGIAKAGATATDSPAGVGVSVSEGARNRVSEQKRAKELAMNAPEVREDRVNAIKSKINAGTYQIDSEKIATGMMREAVMEHLTSEEKK